MAKPIVAKKPIKKGVKSIIRRGPSGGKKSNDFIAVKEDEPANIVPILPTGSIVSIDLHAFWAVNPAVTFACIKNSDDAGDGCPGCQLGDKPGYRAFLPVLDSDGELKVFPFGISVERQLVTLEDELGSIVGKKIRVKRTGTGLATKYQVINLGKEVEVDVSDDDAEAFVEAHIEVKDRDKIVEELENAGLMETSSKKKSKHVEEEDEIEEEETEDETDETDEDEVDEEEEEAPRKKVAPKGKVAPKKVEKPVKKVAKKAKNDDWE